MGQSTDLPARGDSFTNLDMGARNEPSIPTEPQESDTRLAPPANELSSRPWPTSLEELH
jgi:hypothetical protein